jgi:hypothetical protein
MRWFPALALLPCACINSRFTRTSAERPAQPRPAAEIEVLTLPPQRMYVEAGYFEVWGGVQDNQLPKLRSEASTEGCDALVIRPEGDVHASRLFATCIIYK